MQDVDLDAARLVGVERVVADAEHGRVHLDLRVLAVLEAGVAEVDARREVRVGREAFGRDVGRGDAELGRRVLVRGFLSCAKQQGCGP